MTGPRVHGFVYHINSIQHLSLWRWLQESLKNPQIQKKQLDINKHNKPIVNLRVSISSATLPWDHPLPNLNLHFPATGSSQVLAGLKVYFAHSKKLVQSKGRLWQPKIWHLLLFLLGPLGIQYRNYTLEVNQKHPAPPNSQGRPPNVKGDKVKKRPTASVAQWEACRNQRNTTNHQKHWWNARDFLFAARTLIGVPSRVITYLWYFPHPSDSK